MKAASLVSFTLALHSSLLRLSPPSSSFSARDIFHLPFILCFFLLLTGRRSTGSRSERTAGRLGRLGWGGGVLSDYRSRVEGLTGSVSGRAGLNTNGPENQCPLCGGRGQSLIQSPDTCAAPSPPMTAFHVPSVELGSTNRM